MARLIFCDWILVELMPSIRAATQFIRFSIENVSTSCMFFTAFAICRTLISFPYINVTRIILQLTYVPYSTILHSSQYGFGLPEALVNRFHICMYSRFLCVLQKYSTLNVSPLITTWALRSSSDIRIYLI